MQLAPDDILPGEEGMCGKLRHSMYGTRDAAQNWHEVYSGELIKMGFTQGKTSPCVFHHVQKGIRTYVHGDDYVSTGLPHELQWMKTELEKRYQVKTQMLGPESHHQQEIKILNRILQWKGESGIVYEADPRHAELIIEQLHLADAKSVATPGTKEEGQTQEDADVLLGDRDATAYRAIVARCNYLAPDRLDIAFSVKELARKMSKPNRGDWTKLKRLGRYLSGKPRLLQHYDLQGSQRVLKAFSDADWAGCEATRKSTTGGCLTLGTHVLKGWSKTQSLIALSSRESELYATLRAAAEALGVMSMMKDMGYQVSGEVWSDASAALGIIHRKGLGKIRHIDTGLLWIQQTAAEQRLRFQKVLGKNNPADLFTKYPDQKTSEGHTSTKHYYFNTGRAKEAPKLHGVWKSVGEYLMNNDHRYWEQLQLLTGWYGGRIGKRSQPIARREVGIVCRGHQRKCGRRESRASEGRVTIDGLRTAGAPGEQLIGTGVQRFECRPAYQPWGSTLTFRHNAGVSWVHGLRHGVAMHPRGRHLREGMTLLFTWESHTTESEQQPTQQHIYHNHWGSIRRSCCWHNCYYYNHYSKKGKAKDDGSARVVVTRDPECIVLPVQGADQRSSKAFPRTRTGMWTTVN